MKTLIILFFTFISVSIATANCQLTGVLNTDSLNFKTKIRPSEIQPIVKKYTLGAEIPFYLSVVTQYSKDDGKILNFIEFGPDEVRSIRGTIAANSNEIIEYIIPKDKDLEIPYTKLVISCE